VEFYGWANGQDQPVWVRDTPGPTPSFVAYAYNQSVSIFATFTIAPNITLQNVNIVAYAFDPVEVVSYLLGSFYIFRGQSGSIQPQCTDPLTSIL